MISEDSSNMLLYKIKSPWPAVLELALRRLATVFLSEYRILLRVC